MMKVKDYRKVVFGVSIVLVLASSLFLLFCSNSNSTGPEPEEETESNDLIQTLSFVPGIEDSLVFEEHVKISFPENAFESNTEIKVKELNLEENDDIYTNTGVISPLYVLTPHGQVLQSAARVEFETKDIEVPDGMSLEDLDIYTFDGTNFEAQNAVLENGKLACHLSHFSMLFVHMKNNPWGETEIYDDSLYVYKQDGYLCFGNICGKLDVHPLKVILLLLNTPVHNQLIYQVSLYESPTIGFDQLISAKKSCRVLWDNNGKSYEPIWKPNKITEDGDVVDDVISYSENPSNLYTWKSVYKTNSFESYGQEYILEYDENEEVVGDLTKLNVMNINDMQENYQFLGHVFQSDEMVKFINLSELDEDKKYCIKVAMHQNDWLFRFANSRKSSDFKLSEVPFEETPKQPPTVSITAPETNSTYTNRDEVTFSAQVTDAEDGTIEENKIIWSSDKDGELGKGETIRFQNLSVGRHLIRCRTIDSDNLSGEDQINLIITEAPNQKPVVTITSPSNNGTYQQEDANLMLRGSAMDAEDGDITASALKWYSDIAGYLGLGTNINIKNLSVNTHVIKAKATDSEGLSDSSSIIINITEVPNTAPTASFTVSPTSGGLETVFAFDASGSTDHEDDISDLQVRWDFENDGVWDTNYSSQKSATHQYSSEGTFTVKLEVKDSEGLTDQETQNITVESANPNIETGTVDFYGVTYKTVKIGNQWWLAENLKVTRYRNGDSIEHVTDNSTWAGLSTGAYCAYNNEESNADTYGYLYNWYAVNDSRNIAPEGWHVPTDEEWKTLEKALGMSQSEADGTIYRGTNEGSKLAGRADLWDDGSLESNAVFGESGFSALPAGYRNSGNGDFDTLGHYATFWSSTEYSSYFAWYRTLRYNGSRVFRGHNNKQYGFSVRLIRD